MVRPCRLTAVVAGPLLLAALLSATGAAQADDGHQAPTAVDGGAAPGGPGSLSHFGLARKDCLGTSRGTQSKVWFTVAGGVLSDVYYPTIDTTNVETLQLLVTDGRPKPRTSRTLEESMARSCSMKYSPFSRACSAMFSRFMARMAATPAAIASGLPPKVVP